MNVTNTVFRYPVPIDGRFSLKLPKGATILTVQEQQNDPKIWVLENLDNELEKRNFILVDTGQPIEEKDSSNYIGTFQILVEGDISVQHLFETK